MATRTWGQGQFIQGWDVEGEGPQGRHRCPPPTPARPLELATAAASKVQRQDWGEGLQDLRPTLPHPGASVSGDAQSEDGHLRGAAAVRQNCRAGVEGYERAGWWRWAGTRPVPSVPGPAGVQRVPVPAHIPDTPNGGLPQPGLVRAQVVFPNVVSGARPAWSRC